MNQSIDEVVDLDTDSHAFDEIIEQPKPNTEIWAAAFSTPPEYTKQYKGPGGFQGKAISSLYPVFKATELFGPVGLGWGYSILKDEMITGAPILAKDGAPLGCNETTHSMTVELWAERDGHRMTAIGIGLTPFITTNKYGVSTDHEAQKKSLTDALKGGLKMWGISADVYMGEHDNPEYVAHMQKQSAIDKADDKAAEAIKQTQEYEAWKTTNLKLVETATSLNELKKVHEAAVLKASRNEDEKFVKEITLACTKRKEQLQEKNE